MIYFRKYFVSHTIQIVCEQDMIVRFYQNVKGTLHNQDLSETLS